MSDTPKTDHAFEQAFESNYPTSHMTEFAKKQELEITAYKQALEESQKREAMSLDCIKSWKEDEGQDAKRLEWLLSDKGRLVTGLTRGEIDEAMEEAQP